MPARRPRPPGTVAASSLFSANDPGTDRVMKQVEQGLQDLQDKQRFDRSTASGQGAAIETLQGQVSGRLLATPLRLTGTGSGTLPAGTCMVRIRGIGQGGGGGGATSAAGTAGGGAGGSTGELVEAVIGTPGVPLPSAYSWVGGTGGGAGGSAAGGNGQAGADSTFTANSVTYTAKGGAGGGGATGAGNGNWFPVAPAAGTPAVGVSGVLRRTYGIGDDGQVFGAAAAWFSGDGGGGELGPGGLTVGGNTAGNPGGGLGGGGGGAAAAGGASAVGGAGAAGGWIVEFYS